MEPNFWSAIRFTLIFAFTASIVELILGFALALMFDRVFPGKKILFSLMLIPIMIAPSLMAVMFRLILNENIGVIPGFLKIIGSSYSIFDQNNIFLSLIVLDVIQFTAFTFLLTYSALQNMPSEIYEAAAIDGAGALRILRHITLPQMRPVLLFVTVTNIIGSFQVFGQTYIITRGGPEDSTRVLVQYIYETAFLHYRMGYGSAMCWLLFAFIALFSVVQFLAMKERK
jgi:multiple sugar transport system permease protein